VKTNPDDHKKRRALAVCSDAQKGLESIPPAHAKETCTEGCRRDVEGEKFLARVAGGASGEGGGNGATREKKKVGNTRDLSGRLEMALVHTNTEKAGQRGGRAIQKEKGKRGGPAKSLNQPEFVKRRQGHKSVFRFTKRAGDSVRRESQER